MTASHLVGDRKSLQLLGSAKNIKRLLLPLRVTERLSQLRPLSPIKGPRQMKKRKPKPFANAGQKASKLAKFRHRCIRKGGMTLECQKSDTLKLLLRLRVIATYCKRSKALPTKDSINLGICREIPHGAGNLNGRYPSNLYSGCFRPTIRPWAGSLKPSPLMCELRCSTLQKVATSEPHEPRVQCGFQAKISLTSQTSMT